MHICDALLYGCFYSTDTQFDCTDIGTKVEAKSSMLHMQLEFIGYQDPMNPNCVWSIGASPDVYEAGVFNTTSIPWISDIEGSHDVVESGPVSIDCIINRGPNRGCNATSSIKESSNAYVVGVLNLSTRLQS